MSRFDAVLKTARLNRARRAYPGKADARCSDGVVLPDFRPKFPIAFSRGTKVFTIGSCFARNIEEALQPLGVSLPTRGFSAPRMEWTGRANGLLNEFNPGTISRRIADALAGERSSETTIVPSGEGVAGLLLSGGADVTRERALERREEIFNVYAELRRSDVVIITLGYIEVWCDSLARQYLNRMPPPALSKSEPDRFSLRQMDVPEALGLLDKAMQQLADAGLKVVLTVSPVPLQTTFVGEDCMVANEFSKSVLRVCAERLRRKYDNVDYFPSYEIVRTMGLSAFLDDQVHVRDEVVKRITAYMVERYTAAAEAEQAARPVAMAG